MDGLSAIRYSHQQRGMTLVEVVIAIGIAAMLSIAMYGSAIYTMRQTEKNLEHTFAVQLASSEAAAIRASNFDRLTAVDPATLPGNAFERRFTQTRTVPFDPNTTGSTLFTVKYKLTGFGKGMQSVSATEMKLSLTGNQADWTPNQYKDHFLVVTGGQGVNQVMRVVSHNASAVSSGKKTVNVKLTRDLTGANTSQGWASVTPDSASEFAMDYGLFCDVEVSWDGGAGYKTVTETVYVPSMQ